VDVRVTYALASRRVKKVIKK